MNFELLEDRIIEDLFEAEVVFEDRQRYHIPKMNPYFQRNHYNLAPWHIGYLPGQIDREFRNRYYYPRHNRGFWPISRRNYRRVFNRLTWIPLHIQAANYQRFQEVSNQLVKNYEEKTQLLMNLLNELDRNHMKVLPTFKDDRGAEVDFLIVEINILMKKYHHYGKNY